MKQRQNARKCAEIESRRCADCAHSYDWHSRAVDGHLILCRCPFKDEGRWCIFLKDKACDRFKPRTIDNGRQIRKDTP